MQPPLDLKQILPFPLEPAPTLGLFSNYSTVSSSLPACLTPPRPWPLLSLHLTPALFSSCTWFLTSSEDATCLAPRPLQALLALCYTVSNNRS